MSKKDTVMGFYAKGESPEQILASCAKVGVTTTLASIKWWINDHLKGGGKSNGTSTSSSGRTRTSTPKTVSTSQQIQHRPMYAELADVSLNDEQHETLVELFNYDHGDHAILVYTDVDKIFKTEKKKKLAQWLVSHKCAIMAEGGNKIKITQYGVFKMRYPGSEVSKSQLSKHKLSTDGNHPELTPDGINPLNGDVHYSYNRTASDIRNKVEYVPEWLDEKKPNPKHKNYESNLSLINNNQNSDNMSETTTAPAKKTATKKAAPAKKAAAKSAPAKKSAEKKGPTNKDLVRKFMKEGKGKFSAKEILEKIEGQGGKSTVASVRWYMADINANG